MRTMVKFVEDVDPFCVRIGDALVTIGPFKVGDLVDLPEDVASILIRKGKCKIIF